MHETNAPSPGQLEAALRNGAKFVRYLGDLTPDEVYWTLVGALGAAVNGSTLCKSPDDVCRDVRMALSAIRVRSTGQG